MWFSLHKKHTQEKLLLNIFCYSTYIHFLVIVVAFVVGYCCQDRTLRIHIGGSRGAHVIVSPLAQHVQSGAQPLPAGLTKQAFIPMRTEVALKKHIAKNMHQAKAQKTVVSKPLVPKFSKNKKFKSIATIAPAKSISTSGKLISTFTQEPEQHKKPKTLVPEPSPLPKKIEAESASLSSPEPNREPHVTATSAPQHDVMPNTSAQDLELQIPQVVQVSSTLSDASVAFKAVSRAVCMHWRRPVGVSENVICEIQVEINGQGQAHRVLVTMPSGVLLHDNAAQSAATRTQYPREVWNRKLILQF